MYMGQRHGKQAKLTPESSSSNSTNNNKVHLLRKKLSPSTETNELQQTGNLVIAIRMLTMNSNEATSNETTSTSSDKDASSSSSSSCNNNNEIFDQSTLEVNDNQSNVTLQSTSSATPSESVSVVCDTQNTFIIPAASSTYSLAASTSSSCNCGSKCSSLAGKISNMLSNRGKLQASTVPLSQGCTTKAKIKKSNWTLGKLTGRSKRDKKKEVAIPHTSDADVYYVEKVRRFFGYLI